MIAEKKEKKRKIKKHILLNTDGATNFEWKYIITLVCLYKNLYSPPEKQYLQAENEIP